MFKYIVTFAVLISLSACKKTTTTTTPNIPPVVEGDPVQYGTPFSGVVDKQDATIYQVNMRPFSANGNFAGVTARLDSIKSLGTNIIYLMPIFPVGTQNAFNSPYCVKNFKAINTEFGNLTDLRALVDQAHAKNMSVILDWVANHTSWDNPWISSHKDWYLQDGNGNVLSPPGMGWNDVAQLNFNNTTMRLEMIKSMKYWVYTANIDGFRFDYADGPPVDFWKQAVDTLRAISSHKLLLLAEGSRNANFTAGFDFNFGFNFYGQLKSVFGNNQSGVSFDNVNVNEYTNASNGQQIVRYTSNHDVNGSDGTPLDLFGGRNGSLAAFVIAAYMKGVPMLYGSQEVGTTPRITFPFTSVKINWNINPDITDAYRKILVFRNTSNAVKRGLLTSYSSTDVCAFTKEVAGEKVMVLVNLRNSVVNFTLPANLANTNWTDAMNQTPISLTTSISLQPYQYIIGKQ